MCDYWGKNNILRDVFINISRIIGISRRPSYIFFTNMHTDEYPVSRDLEIVLETKRVDEPLAAAGLQGDSLLRRYDSKYGESADSCKKS